MVQKRRKWLNNNPSSLARTAIGGNQEQDLTGNSPPSSIYVVRTFKQHVSEHLKYIRPHTKQFNCYLDNTGTYKL